MILLLTVFHGLVILFLAWRTISAMPDRTIRIHGWISLVLKISCGVLIGLLYSKYYESGDTFLFHRLGEQLAEIGRFDFGSYLKMIFGILPPPEPDVLLPASRLFFMVKIVSVLNLLTFGNYWISGAYLSLFCWFGMFRVSVTFAQNYPGMRQLSLVAGLYIPSVVFWSSGLTKESVAMGLFGLLLAILLPGGRKTWVNGLVVLVLLIFLWMIKYYYAVPLVFAVTVFYLLQKMSQRGLRWYWQFLVVAGSGGLIFLISGFLNINFDWNYFPEVLYQNYMVITERSDPGSSMILADYCPEWSCVFINFHKAVWGTLFRPYIWEVHHLPGFVAGFENLIFLLLFVFFVLSLRQSGTWTVTRLNATISSILFIIIIAGFLGLSSPNFGTLVRYRIILLPVFVVVAANTRMGMKFLSLFSRD